jgi:hypothetical protein
MTTAVETPDLVGEVVLGALYDFAKFLQAKPTLRKTELQQHVIAFAEKEGFNPNTDVVINWNKTLACVFSPVISTAEKTNTSPFVNAYPNKADRYSQNVVSAPLGFVEAIGVMNLSEYAGMFLASRGCWINSYIFYGRLLVETPGLNTLLKADKKTTSIDTHDTYCYLSFVTPDVYTVVEWQPTVADLTAKDWFLHKIDNSPLT